MNRRNALFAGHDEGGRSWPRFASLIGTCKINGVEPYAYLVDLFTRLATGHLDKDIDALMPWAFAAATNPHNDRTDQLGLTKRIRPQSKT